MRGMHLPTISWNMRKSPEVPPPPPRQAVRILENRAHAGGLFTLVLENPGMTFQPGDCIAVYGADGRTTRPYSLAGSVHATTLELLIRRIPGGEVSGMLATKVPGDAVEITPPFGWFRPASPAGVPKVYFATGSGMAPFLSAMRSGAPPPRAGYWGVRCLEDLDGVQVDGFRACVSCGPSGTHHAGRITALLPTVPLEPDLHYYACGVDAMIEEVRNYLAARGVAAGRFHSECFFTAQS